jgi:hypothetical protein
MAKENASHSVQLTPALLLDCKLTWKKLASFVIYGNVVACFLYLFGFGSTFSYAVIFCNCAAWPGFFFLLAAKSLPKAATPSAMGLRIGAILFLGTLTGAVIFAAITGVTPLALLDQRIDILIRMLFLNAFCGSSMLFFFKTGERISEATRLIMEERIINLDMKNISVEMELKLLQAQIEPHFLFNTLSNVISLIDTEPDKAKGMLNHFCGFLRGSLHIARNATVPISQEMELIGNYLEIQKLRMGDRLNYQIDMPPSLLDKEFPPLLIQPLVENSIKHGLEPRIEGGNITITGEIDGDVVRITVTDSGGGITENAMGNGVGLENVRRRIRMSSHAKGKLILEENIPCGVRAVLETAR